jgi:uncharacterized protein YvpB
MRRSLPITLVAAVVMLLASGLIATPRAAAADDLGVTAWITVGSLQPAVGCGVPVSVEVRTDGNAVSQTDVAVALFVGDDVVSTDREVTDGSGVAYLSIDTSPLSPGGSAWVDVNVAGAYLTGFSLAPNSNGACDGAGEMIRSRWSVPVVWVAADTSGAGSFPTYVQQRNLSCEYAALQIATTAWGNGVSEYSFDDVVGWSPDPHWGYRGDITGWWGNTDDYGVYAEALAAALPTFGFNGYVFYGQGDASGLMSELDAGVPTLVWFGEWGDQSHYEELDGTSFKLVAGMHVVVAYAYDDSGVYVSDPASGTLKHYSWDDFMYMWNVLDGMALAVTPA